MKLKINILPGGRREWLWVVLQIQWSFWQEAYPAMMITDTAIFRYPHYHKRSDTPDKIDYDRMSRVVAGIGAVVVDLTKTRWLTAMRTR